jgi:hypothetical protein
MGHELGGFFGILRLFALEAVLAVREEGVSPKRDQGEALVVGHAFRNS